LARVPADFGLTRREASFLRGLKPAWRIQRGPRMFQAGLVGRAT